MKLSAVLDSKRKKNLIFFPHAKQDVVGSVEELKAQAIRAVQENRLQEAKSLAGQAAIMYGAAGLLLHHHIDLADLKVQLQGPFGAESQAIEALALLRLCRYLALHDAEEAEKIHALFPEDDIASDAYWNNLKQELINLAKLSDGSIEQADITYSVLATSYQSKSG